MNSLVTDHSDKSSFNKNVGYFSINTCYSQSEEMKKTKNSLMEITELNYANLFSDVLKGGR